MARIHTPRQQFKEACQIAREHGLFVAERPTAKGTDYVVYRRLPDGRAARLGKRSTPEALRRFVSRCANFH
ncbi:MAG: hypothetical protein AB1409_08325 [Pseudomonadota bacterium]